MPVSFAVPLLFCADAAPGAAPLNCARVCGGRLPRENEHTVFAMLLHSKKAPSPQNVRDEAGLKGSAVPPMFLPYNFHRTRANTLFPGNGRARPRLPANARAKGSAQFLGGILCRGARSAGPLGSELRREGIPGRLQPTASLSMAAAVCLRRQRMLFSRVLSPSACLSRDIIQDIPADCKPFSFENTAVFGMRTRCFPAGGRAAAHLTGTKNSPDWWFAASRRAAAASARATRPYSPASAKACR